MTIDCFIFDLDGTLADSSHRIHHLQKKPKDFDAFHAAQKQDDPIDVMQRLYAVVSKTWLTLIVTGREERFRGETLSWLRNHMIFPYHVYMRPDGDRRNDDNLKAEILDQIRASGLNPILAFEDRPRVARMYRSKGVTCLQINDVEF